MRLPRIPVASLGAVFLVVAFSPKRFAAAAPENSPTATSSLEQRIADIAANPVFEVPGIRFTGERLMIPVFGFTRDGLRISPAQFQELRSQRDAAVAILRRDIAKASPETLTKSQDAYAYDSRLLMLLDLNASEALEDLIAAFGRVPPAEFPDDRPVFVGGRNRLNFTHSVLDRDRPDIATLSAILALLYCERDPAVLKSEFADVWKKALNCKGNTLSEAEYRAQPSEKRMLCVYDPWEKRAILFPQSVSVEWTPERQKTILAMANDFAKRVPVEQRARAKNMVPELCAR